MKKFILITLILLISVIFMWLPLCASGQDYNENWALKAGTYQPSGDLDDRDFDSGLALEFVYTSSGSKYFSIEGGVGVFVTDNSQSEFVGGVGLVEEDADIMTSSVFFTLLGHLPFKFGEIYGGAGLDWLTAMVYYDIDTPIGSASFNDTDYYVFGGHVVAGLNFNITERFFIGAEGKYLVTTEASWSDTDEGLKFETDENLNGYLLFGQVGYRF